MLSPKGLGCSPYKNSSSLKASKILEFLRINLEFLKDCFARNDKILEFIEIASVALLPRNDKNSRIP